VQEIDLDVKVYRKAMRSTTILVSALVPWMLQGLAMGLATRLHPDFCRKMVFLRGYLHG
jgi:hypothetical protein